MRHRHPCGLTLVELLLVLAILALLAIAGVPALGPLLERHRLTGAMETVFNDLRLARAEAIRRNLPVSISFHDNKTTGHWCYAPSDRGGCNCFRPNDCTLDGSPAPAVSDRGFRRILLTSNFRRHTATFHPARGSANAGTVTLVAGDRRAAVTVSSLGRIRVCADHLPGYPPC